MSERFGDSPRTRSDTRSGGYHGNGGGFGGGNGNSGNGGGGGGSFGAYIPPHSIEAEQSTLGAMLIERAAVEKVFEILEKDDFYRDAHQTLYDVITTLAERDEPIDLITVQEELKNRDKLDSVGIPYLLSLFDTVPTAANVEFYARIVEEKSTLRRLIEAAMEIIGTARGEIEDVGEVLDQAERAIFGVSQQRATAYFSPLKTLLLQVYGQAEELGELKSRISGLSTGIHDFDMITSGLQSTDLIIVAARPSMGKTSLCLSIAEHVALKEKKPVAIFSLEMSKEQLALRMLCSQAQVNSHRLRTGHLTEDEWTKLALVVQGMYEAPIFIDDATETSALTMRAKCRRLMAEHDGLGLIIVDYLQLMRSHRRIENRTQEIGEIARGLKSLGRELKVPVVALSQLSRAVESRENKRPMLSDLRECVTGDTRLIDATTGCPVPICEVQAGSLVLAVDGRQKVRPFAVERVWSTGIKPVFTLRTRTGREITATANHPLLTAQGWKRLEELAPGDILATAMRLPGWIWESGKVGAAQFFAGYFSADGCVKKAAGRGWLVHVDTVSRRLAEDTQMLLLRLGIVATIRSGDRGKDRGKKATPLLYRVSVIGADNLRRFAAAVQPGGQKGALLTQMASELTDSATHSSVFSLPPEVSALLTDKNKNSGMLPGNRLRRDLCAHAAESLKDEVLSVWANSDLLWEDIQSIVPAGEAEVFDITVPGCANFLANGIVAHNSGSIEAEADMVCFLYRESYYKMKEAFQADAEDRPQRQEMEETEIIVGKHRNGPTGVVKVGFMPEFAKFVDLDLTRTDEPTGF